MAADRCGAVRQVDELLDDGRLIVSDASGACTVVERAQDLRHARISGADRVMLDTSARFAVQVLPREHTDTLVYLLSSSGPLTERNTPLPPAP